MEKWQTCYITKNMVTLIESTHCNILLLTYLRTSHALTEWEVTELERLVDREGYMCAARKLFRILKGKEGSYEKLIDALRNTKQTGAEKILLKGYKWKENLEPDFDFGSEFTGMWFNVRMPKQIFVGRKEELYKLHDILTTQVWSSKHFGVVVTGPSGIGKTEFVLKYIQEYKEWYDNIIWLDADNSSKLYELICNLSDHDKFRLRSTLTTKSKRLTELSEILRGIYNPMALSNSLMVFDHADKQVQGFLPINMDDLKATHFTIILTSRINEWDENFLNLTLDGLNQEDAVFYVQATLHSFISGNMPPLLEIQKFLNQLSDEEGIFTPIVLQEAAEKLKRRLRIDAGFKLGNFKVLNTNLPKAK